MKNRNKAILEAIKKRTTELTRNPEKAKEYLNKLGTHTKSGNLSTHYK